MKRRIISIMLAICMVFLSVPISVNAMSIYVDLSIIGETTLTIEVESGDSIENVKEKIKNETGYPERNQRLKYNGKVLKDGRTLADYNIQKYNTIELSFAPSVSAYVTKEQMMDGTFAPNESGVALNTGKLVFGKNSSGASQQWYILGKDSGVSGDNTIIFAASPIATNQVFNSSTSDKTYHYEAGTGYGESVGSTTVFANHYGASDLRSVLQTMATNENYFTAAEQGMMNPTTVTTKDTNNSATYITTDKLYALQGDENYNNDKYLWAGTSDSTVLAKNSYWSSGDTFWLRSPYDFSDISALLAYPGSCVYCGRVNGEGAVQPASNLNLSSVLFASAATAASSGTVSGTITDGTAMTLRLDGTGKNIGTVTYNTTTGDIKAAKGSTEGNVALVVQGNDGRNDWYYSKQITGTEIVNVSDIVAESNTPASIDLSNCNIWIETTESNVAYAVDATEVTISSISSVAITGIETPAANTTLDTSASCATTGVSSTSLSVTWTPNDSKAGYNTSYTASITLTADTFYEFADNVAATVLGINATSVTKNADGTLTVTYKFNATSQKPSQELIDYDILDGADSNRTLNSDGSLSIRGSGEFFKFVGVKVDGTLIDAKHYTVKEGSTIITLKADYLNTLSVGNHTIEIVWTDGSAGTRFTIKENEEINGPNTGDTFNYLWIMALMISGLTLVVPGRKKIS